MTPDPAKTVLIALFFALAAGGFIFSLVLLWRGRRQDRRWRHETRVQQRVSELLQQEYEELLSPEEKARREAQRQHLAELRARAEAELAAEEARRGRR